MNLDSLNARLRTTTKSNTVRALVLDLARTGTVRPCWTTGSGRWTSNTDRTAEAIAAAKACGLTVTLTNEAPKGSPTGNVLTLDAPSRRKAAPIRAAWRAEQAAKRAQAEAERVRAAKDAAEVKAREDAAIAAFDPAGATGHELLLRWGIHAAKHCVSIRCAPPSVVAEKERLNASWNQMKEACRLYLTA